VDTCGSSGSTTPYTAAPGLPFSTDEWSVVLPSGFTKLRSPPTSSVVLFKSPATDDVIISLNSKSLKQIDDYDALRPLLAKGFFNQPYILTHILNRKLSALQSQLQQMIVVRSSVRCVGHFEVAEFVYLDRSTANSRYSIQTTFVNSDAVVEIEASLNSIERDSNGFRDYEEVVESFRLK
jgi:hypothetical protein